MPASKKPSGSMLVYALTRTAQDREKRGKGGKVEKGQNLHPPSSSSLSARLSSVGDSVPFNPALSSPVIILPLGFGLCGALGLTSKSISLALVCLFVDAFLVGKSVV